MEKTVAQRPSMLRLSYAFLVFLTDIPLEWFTSASICGMN
jgi:hypothetical protein